MADDVQPQQEGMRTLHLRLLRIQWQVVTLQLISTIALLWMYLKMVDLYIVDSIDHALAIKYFDQQLSTANLEMPLPAWLTGEDAIGLGKFYPIMGLSVIVGGSIALLTFQSPTVQRKVRMGLLLGFILWLFGPFMFKWIVANFGKGEWWIPPDNSVESLFKGVIVVLEVMLIGIYIVPLILGVRGVWGLSKNAIAWSTGIMLLFLVLHALLTFQIVEDLLFGTSGEGLKKIPSLAGDPTILGLISPNQFNLLQLSLLLIIFQESSMGVIRYLEYAFRLPETCKKDPEYVTQFYNLLNGHLVQTIVLMTLCGITTIVALGFHTLLLSIVASLPGDGQWAYQIQESIELELTYGLVISAMLFLLILAGLRYILPWQRISGVIESLYRKRVEEIPKEEY
ncbi:MAG: hypothetical protein CMB56_004240 [Methanobacteriota archaeon]|nr:MAG: hypothetical protein CMB56_004240 [Euryarchaeota archaeon]|tara:strand:- start:17216 stop:18406 length:1191 start_codon:yes stop_codon:yes gene_type:complete